MGVAALSDLKMVSQSALWYFFNSRLNLCKFEISHQFTRHFVTNASRQLLESLQGVRRTTQISEKVELVTKIVWLPWQHQISKFLSGCQ